VVEFIGDKNVTSKSLFGFLMSEFFLKFECSWCHEGNLGNLLNGLVGEWVAKI
jgi:hypothetical protein